MEEKGVRSRRFLSMEDRQGERTAVLPTAQGAGVQHCERTGLPKPECHCRACCQEMIERHRRRA
jgi:hypothetical protein